MFPLFASAAFSFSSAPAVMVRSALLRQLRTVFGSRPTITPTCRAVIECLRISRSSSFVLSILFLCLAREMPAGAMLATSGAFLGSLVMCTSTVRPTLDEGKPVQVPQMGTAWMGS